MESAIFLLGVIALSVFLVLFVGWLLSGFFEWGDSSGDDE